MEKEKNYVLSAKIDKTMNDIVLKIKKEIEAETFNISNWDSFIESAILVFYKMIKNDISPLIFDSFIETYAKTKTDKTHFDA